MEQDGPETNCELASSVCNLQGTAACANVDTFAHDSMVGVLGRTYRQIADRPHWLVHLATPFALCSALGLSWDVLSLCVL